MPRDDGLEGGSRLGLALLANEAVQQLGIARS